MLITESPRMTPDSLRAFLQTNKRFYDLHVPRNKGYMDLSGLQYVSTVENFGSELLLETRKLRMNRPPAEVVKPNANMQYYFDLMHSDLIETYDQQNLLMAVLKPNVMYHDHTYTIQFTGGEIVYELRAEAYGENDRVHASKWFRTYENPVLQIDDEEPIPLFVGEEDNTDHHVVWYFPLNDESMDYIASLTEHDFQWTLTTIDLVSSSQLPFIWLCSEAMRMLPDFVMEGNEDSDGDPILTFGTTSQDSTMLYPMITDGLLNIQSTGYWYIQAYGDFKYTTGQHLEDVNPLEFDSKITHLEICWRAETMPERAWDAPDIVMPIDFESSFVKMTMAPTLIRGIPVYAWHMRTPKSGDYDYSSAPYNNNPVAYCMLHNFEGNIVSDENPDPELLPALRLHFDDKYFHPYESEINHARVGIHADCTSDYSDHSVEKKCGVVYNLGDFDGLPEFYQRYLDRTIHHAHVELYAIRDDANVRNQKTMDKQTAAIIIDTAVPQNDLKEITDDMKPVIVYDIDREYITVEDNITSDMNFLSNIGFQDAENFVDVTIPGRENLPKFVYHGNREFSLGIIEFDERTEYGRVYLISNDGINYDNNASSRIPKAPRTAARICDIPTNFDQLQNIQGVAPTLVFDQYYVRQLSMMTMDTFNMAWSDRSRSVFTLHAAWSGQPEKIYFPSLSELRFYSRPGDIIRFYGEPDLEAAQIMIDLNDETQCTHELIGSGLTGNYRVGDQFGFNIGGIFIVCTVTAVDQYMSGPLYTITDYALTTDRSIPDQPELLGRIFPITNFNSRIWSIVLNPLNVHASNPPMLKITLDEDLWNMRNDRTLVNVPSQMLSFVSNDDTNGISVTEYTGDNDTSSWSDAVQLTGDMDIGNIYYDDPATRSHRDTTSVFLRNMLMNKHVEYDDIFGTALADKTIEIAHKNVMFEYPDFTVDQLFDGTDLSRYMSDLGMNVWNSFLTVVPSQDRTTAHAIAWYYDANASFVEPNGQNGNLLFPKRSGMNVNDYDDTWSSIKLTYVEGKPMPFMYDIMHKTHDVYTYNGSVLRLQSQQNIRVAEMLPIDERYPSDASDAHNNVQALFNIYRFDHLDQYKELKAFRGALTGSSPETLLDFITSKFGDDTIASKYYGYTVVGYAAGTDYVENTLICDYTTNKLYQSNTAFRASTIDADLLQGFITYIGMNPQADDLLNYYFENLFHRPVYNETRVARFTQAGTIMSTQDDDPIGGFVPIRDTIDERVYINKAPYKAEPLYAFSVNVEPYQLESFLSDFRMYDGNVDISENTLMIVNGHFYLFYNNRWNVHYTE